MKSACGCSKWSASMAKQPAIRDIIQEGVPVLEIDAQKGEWPYIRAHKVGAKVLFLHIDSNLPGQVIGEGGNMAAIELSKKKALRLAGWIYENFS